MLVRWRELAPQTETEGQREGRVVAELFYRACRSRDWKEAEGLLLRLDPRLALDRSQSDSGEEEVFLLLQERTVRPLACWLQELAPKSQVVHLGRRPRSHEWALSFAEEETGVSLSRSRVRVGFSRGHLIEVVVQVPLDIEGSSDCLQIAAELYLEACVGDEVLDLWVSDISVDRIARSRGLMVFSDSQSLDENYPLKETASLVLAGVAGVSQALPSSLLGPSELSATWTALDIPSVEGALQGDRCFASTIHPEALKAALEGLPFSSCRFTRGPEVFLWLSWESKKASLEERLRKREEAEGLISALLPLERGILAGSGFGSEREYLDLWLLPEPHLLRSLANSLAVLVGRVELGFYDGEWAEETISFSPPHESDL